jgi:hypothetical protein
MTSLRSSLLALSRDQRGGSEMVRFLILAITLALLCLTAFRRLGGY